MAKYEWTMYQIKVNLVSYWNQFCYIFFQFWEILSQTRVSFFNTQFNRTNTQNLEKSNFDMFYKFIRLLSSYLLSNMCDQCVIWKRNNSTIIPCY